MGIKKPSTPLLQAARHIQYMLIEEDDSSDTRRESNQVFFEYEGHKLSFIVTYQEDE